MSEAPWLPIKEAEQEGRTGLVFVPASRLYPGGPKEDFDMWHVAYFKGGMWKLQDDNQYVRPTHFQELTRPTEGKAP